MLKDIYRNLLIEINEDVNRDGLIKTPERAAKALEYLVSGYNRDIHEIVNGALFDVKCEDIVVVKNIKFYSLCEHHILPFFGMCSVGYIPNSNAMCQKTLFCPHLKLFHLLLNLFLNQKKNWLMKAGFIFFEKYLNREIKK